MDKKNITVILEAGHGVNTPGKRSPKLSDGRVLREYAWTREIVMRIYNALVTEGYECALNHVEIEEVGGTNADLKMRVNRVNQIYKDLKASGKTAIFISVHINAAGSGQWMTARGWSAWTTKGTTKSDAVADCLYDAAQAILPPLGINVRTDKSDGDRDYESNFYVLKNTNCPAVLTENLFMDNEADALWLMSEEGRTAITKVHVDGIKRYIDKA